MDEIKKYNIKIEKEENVTIILFRNGLTYEIRKDDVTIISPDNNFDYQKNIIIASKNFLKYDWTIKTDQNDSIIVYAHTKEGIKNDNTEYKVNVSYVIPVGKNADIRDVINVFGYIIREVKSEIKRMNPEVKNEVGF